MKYDTIKYLPRIRTIASFDPIMGIETFSPSNVQSSLSSGEQRERDDTRGGKRQKNPISAAADPRASSIEKPFSSLPPPLPPLLVGSWGAFREKQALNNGRHQRDTGMKGNGDGRHDDRSTINLAAKCASRVTRAHTHAHTHICNIYIYTHRSGRPPLR